MTRTRRPIARKSPVHPQAATIGQIHASPATWVIFELQRNGEIKIEDIGQFLTGFHPKKDGMGHYELVAEFRATYHHPYFGRQTWIHTPAYLGLMPSQQIQHYYPDGYEAIPPAEGTVRACYGYEMAVPDLRDPFALWEPRFLVKIQHAHRVMGCTPGEFRRIHVAGFMELVGMFADVLFQNDADDQRDAADHLLAGRNS